MAYKKLKLIKKMKPTDLPLRFESTACSREKKETSEMTVSHNLNYSGAPAAQRAAKRSPITIGTGSHACIEIETHATLFSW